MRNLDISWRRLRSARHRGQLRGLHGREKGAREIVFEKAPEAAGGLVEDHAAGGVPHHWRVVETHGRPQAKAAMHHRIGRKSQNGRVSGEPARLDMRVDEDLLVRSRRAGCVKDMAAVRWPGAIRFCWLCGQAARPHILRQKDDLLSGHGGCGEILTLQVIWPRDDTDHVLQCELGNHRQGGHADRVNSQGSERNDRAPGIDEQRGSHDGQPVRRQGRRGEQGAGSGDAPGERCVADGNVVLDQGPPVGVRACPIGYQIRQHGSPVPRMAPS